MADQQREGGLLSWQWGLYPDGHTTRKNLLIHILTVPIFGAGSLVFIFGLFTAPLVAIGGLLMMAAAMAAQGQGHATEPQAPVRFRGPFDVASRILAEQWIAFPRFVLTGRFAQAWRRSASPEPRH